MAKKAAEKKAAKRTAKIRRCKCAEQIDLELAKQGYCLSSLLHMNFEAKRADVICPLVRVEHLGPPKRGRKKMPNIVATFCPFCGKRLMAEE